MNHGVNVDLRELDHRGSRLKYLNGPGIYLIDGYAKFLVRTKLWEDQIGIMTIRLPAHAQIALGRGFASQGHCSVLLKR